MSYILEALKKSEMERTRGTAPTLHAIHAEPFLQERKGVWLYALAACVLVATVIIGWQRPWQIEHNATGEMTPSRAASVIPPRIAPQTPVDVKPVHPPIVARQETPAQVSQTTKLKIEPPAAKAHLPVSENQVKAPTPVASAAPSRSKAETPAQYVSHQDFIDFSELPAAIQQALNKLVVTGYVGSPDDPSGQMIVIENRLLREGDEVSPNLKLEQIAAGKAVFGYKGYHFRILLP